MTRLTHTLTMIILVLTICIVIGYASWLSLQKVGGIYRAQTENGLDFEDGTLAILLSLRLVLWLVLLVIIALGVVLVAEHLYLRKNTKRLELEANYDMLTGAGSRRYGCDYLAQAFLEFEKSGVSPMVIVFDLDHLEAINDSYGHGMGDRVLRGVVEVVYQNIGRSDLVIRWGGDEFVAVLHGLEDEDVGAVGAQLVQAVSATSFQIANEMVNPSISLGASYFHPGDQSFSDALARADGALYQAKKSGKNMAYVADQDRV